MCIITDEQDIVISISFIPGLSIIPDGWHVYFPFVGDLPDIGDYFKE